MNTLQKAWERSRNIIRKAQGHDPLLKRADHRGLFPLHRGVPAT